MNLGIKFYSIILFSIVVSFLVFTLGDYQIINASPDPQTPDRSGSSSSSSSSSVQQNPPDQTTFFLPFNSGIADQSTNEKTYSSEALPFP